MASCKRLRTDAVICEGNVQEVGEVTIPLPTGVTIDPLTGQLNVKPVPSVVGNPVLNDAIITGKIINYGWAHVLLTITGIPTPVSAHYTIPLQGELSCPDVLPTDAVTHAATLLGTLVYGVPTVDPLTGMPVGGNLYRVEIKLKIKLPPNGPGGKLDSSYSSDTTGSANGIRTRVSALRVPRGVLQLTSTMVKSLHLCGFAGLEMSVKCRFGS